MKRLAPRQRQVLLLTARGLTAGEIGRELGISAQTAGGYLQGSYNRLQAVSAPHALALALTAGQLSLDELAAAVEGSEIERSFY